MAQKPKNIHIEKVNPKGSVVGYTSQYYGRNKSATDSMEYSDYALRWLNENGLNNFQPIEAGVGITPQQNIGLTTNANMLKKVREEGFINLVDSETTGVSNHAASLMGKHGKLFDVEQISIKTYKLNPGGNPQLVDSLDLATQISKDTYRKAKQLIDSIEVDNRNWDLLDADERRSLSDFILYSNKDNITTQNIEGKAVKVLTGQHTDRPSVNIASNQIGKHIGKMRQGLEIAYNDFTSKEDAIQALNLYQNKNPYTISTYNVPFDIPSIQEYFGKSLDNSAFGNAINRDNVLDIYDLQKVYAHANPNYQGKNNTLQQVYKTAFGQRVQTHNAGDDVEMLADVANKLIYSESSNVFNFSKESISPQDIYIANRGIQRNPNGFNQGEMLYSGVFGFDGKNFVQEHAYNSQAIIRNHKYQVLGKQKAEKINGVQHYAFAIRDLTADTHNIFMSPNPNYLEDIFGGGLMTNIKNATKENIEYAYADNSRRAMDRIFKGQLTHGNQDPVLKLQKYMNIADDFAAMNNGRVNNTSLKTRQEAMSKLYNRDLKKWKDRKGPLWERPNPTDYENAITAAPFLRENRSLIRETISQTNSQLPYIKGDAGRQAQRLNILKKVGSAIEDNYSEINNRVIGKTGQKLLPLQFSVKNEFTYMDVSSPTQFLSSMRNQLTQKSSESTNNVMQRFNMIMNQYEVTGGENARAIAARYKLDVQRDIREHGRILPSTVERISGGIYSSVSTHNNVQEGIFAHKLETRYAGLHHEANHATQLRPMNSKFAKKIVDDALAEVTNASKYGVLINNDVMFTKEMLDRIEVNNQAKAKVEQHILGSQKFHGLDQGEIKKSREMLSIRQFDVQQGIVDTIKEYERQNFDVTFQFNKDNNKMELFYAPKSTKTNLIGRTRIELLNDNKVGYMTIPLFNENITLDTRTASITGGYSVVAKESGGYTLVSKQETAFKELKKIARAMRRKIEKLEERGEKIDYQDIFNTSNSVYTSKISRGSSAAAYGTGDTRLVSNISIDKAFVGAGVLDATPLVEKQMRMDNPSQYQRWLDFKRQNPNANLMDSSEFWIKEKRNYPSAPNATALRIKAAQNFGNETGVSLYAGGVSVSASQKGFVGMIDPLHASPLGIHGSMIRETGEKALNYIEIEDAPIRQRLIREYRDKYKHLSHNKQLYEQRVEEAVKRRMANTGSGIDRVVSMNPIDMNKTKSVQAVTQFVNDNELYQKVQNKIKEMDLEIANIQSEINVLNPQEKNYKTILSEKLSEIESIEKLKSKGKMLSAHEGQQIMRKSFADSIVTDNLREIRIGENELLPKELIKQIARINGVDYQEGMSLGMRNGEVIHLDGINEREMFNLGLLDEKNRLTVGEVAQYDELLEGGEYSTKAVDSRLLKGELNLESITMEDNKYVINIRQTEKVSTGSKIMGAQGQGRYSVVVMDDEVMDAFGFGVDIISENPKFERANMDGYMLTYFNTAQHQILEELEGKDLSNLDRNNLSKPVREAIERMEAKGINITNESIQDVALEAMSPAANELGWNLKDGSIGYVDPEKGGLFVINANTMIAGADDRERTLRASNFARRLRDEYNVSSDSMIQEFSKHNVFNYSGQTTIPQYSSREYELLRNTGKNYKNNVLIDKYTGLRSQYGDTSVARYSRDILEALDSNDTELTNLAKTKGNVIIDMSGEFKANMESNFYINEDGAFVLDGLSLNSDDTPTNNIKRSQGIMLRNQTLTAEEIAAAGLPENFESISIGELKELNPNTKVMMKIEEVGENNFGRAYVPIFDSIEMTDSNFEASHARVPEGKLGRIYNVAKERTLYGDNEGQLLIQGRQAVREYQEEMERFITSSSRGSTTKATSRYSNKYGGSYKIQRYNIAHEYLNEELTRQNMVIGSRADVSKMISGLEDNILAANNITDDMLDGISKNEFILNQIDISNENDEFKLFGIVDRNPHQTSNNIKLVEYRVDNNVADGSIYGTTSLYTSLKADFDGDTGNVAFDIYRDLDGQNLPEMQKELRAYSEFENKALEAMKPEMDEDINPNAFRRLAEATVDDLDDLSAGFQNRRTVARHIETYLGQQSKGMGIGMIDNTRMRSLRMINEYYSSMERSGLQSTEFVNTKIKQAEDIMGDFLQSLISTKKREAEQWGISDSDNFEAIMEKAISSDTETTRILEAFRQVDFDADEIADSAIKLGYLKNNPDSRQSFIDVLEMNRESISYYRDRGIDLDSIDIGLSRGRVGNNFVKAIEDGNLQNHFIDDTTIDMIESIAPDLLEQAKTIRTENAEGLGDYVTSYTNRKNYATMMSEGAEEVFEELNRLTTNQRMLRDMQNNETISNTLKNGFSRVVNSTAFKVGAGVAGMWMVSSMLKGGPDIDGNEAQQATPVEVAPAALLTSPTARVTPRGENVTVNISGKGRVDSVALAGIINSTISQQTSMQMDMNLYQTDNIQTLDNKFYEEQISKALGLN